MNTMQAATRATRFILLMLLSGPMFAALALAESRSATAVMGVRIERHAGVVIAGSSASVTQDQIAAAAGNGTARLIFSGQRPGALAPAQDRIAARTQVTVFEP
jgi:uncharacterized protein YgbK (DUF1537 family)